MVTQLASTRMGLESRLNCNVSPMFLGLEHAGLWSQGRLGSRGKLAFCTCADGPTCRSILHLVPYSAVIFMKFLVNFEKSGPHFPFVLAPQITWPVLCRTSVARYNGPRRAEMVNLYSAWMSLVVGCLKKDMTQGEETLCSWDPTQRGRRRRLPEGDQGITSVTTTGAIYSMLC